MHRFKALAGVLCLIALLAAVGCQAEPETVTLTSTATAQAPMVTVTNTVTGTPPTEIQTITQTTTVTQTVTTSPAATTTTTEPTTTTTGGFEPVTSVDGRLQIVFAELVTTGLADHFFNGEVKNLSDETLNAHITAEFLNAAGGVDQTHYTTIYDIAPGEQKTFSIPSTLSFSAFAGFNVYVEIA